MTGLRKVLSPAYTSAMNLLSGMAQARTRASTSAICAQPTSVIASPFDLEFFRMDQCVEEVEAKPDGDDQSDDRFTHSLSLLQLTEREGVGAHQRQSRQTERYERDVEHVRLLTWMAFNADLRKHSIAN